MFYLKIFRRETGLILERIVIIRQIIWKYVETIVLHRVNLLRLNNDQAIKKRFEQDLFLLLFCNLFRDPWEKFSQTKCL